MSAEMLEHVPCPVCGADDAEVRHRVRDHLFGQPDEFNLVRCRGCRVLYLNPRPTLAGLQRFYPDTYFCYQPLLADASPGGELPGMGGLTGALAESRIRQLERHVGQIPRAARILDVGCGANAFLYHLHRLRGCETLGIDTNAAVVRAINERMGLPAVEGTLLRPAGTPVATLAGAAALPAGHFDGVAMYEYLEHEGRPREVLAEARRVSKPGAWLVIETPDASSRIATIFGRKWCQLDAPRHLVLYDPTTIRSLLESAGYEVLAVQRLTYQWMFGFSLLVALGLRNMGRLGPFETVLGVALTLPFLPLPWIWPEFMRVYARVRS
jgi:SAM-dependent methyltransferase